MSAPRPIAKNLDGTRVQLTPFDRRNRAHMRALRAFCASVLAEVDVHGQPSWACVAASTLGDGQGQAEAVDGVGEQRGYLELNLALSLQLDDDCMEFAGEPGPEDEVFHVGDVQHFLTFSPGDRAAEVDERTVGNLSNDLQHGVSHGTSPVAAGFATIPESGAPS